MTQDEPADQYAHSAIPAAERVSGWRVGMIVASFSIGLPDFLNAAQIGMALGLRQAILASLLAGLCLCLGGSLTSRVAVRTRLSTYALIERSFGHGGAAIINSAIALISFCWFGVNASFFGEALGGAARANGVRIDMPALIVGGAILMTVSTIIGFRALDRLASIAVPVLAVVLGTVAVLAVRHHGVTTASSPHPPVPLRFGIAVSALVGSNMLAVATMPDLARFIRSERGAVGAMALSFPVAAPIMMTVSAIPALALHETSIASLVMRLGLGTPVLFLLVLPTLTVNALNLYSASLALSTVLPSVRLWIFTVAGGVIGTGLALAGIIDAFIPFLLLLGIVIPPIAAVYAIDVLVLAKRPVPATHPICWRALAAWGASVAAALLLARVDGSLTTIPALDATIFAAAAYLMLNLRVVEGRMKLRDQPLGEALP